MMRATAVLTNVEPCETCTTMRRPPTMVPYVARNGSVAITAFVNSSRTIVEAVGAGAAALFMSRTVHAHRVDHKSCTRIGG